METPIPKALFFLLCFGSYRTYEEWKHELNNLSGAGGVSGSYRTYEEWKRGSGTAGLWNFYLVLTVPMRNGN